MKFVKVQNHFFHIDNICDIAWYNDFDQHFKKIGRKYFVVPFRGEAIEIKSEEYEELLKILYGINHSENKEA